MGSTTSTLINKFERKKREKREVRAEKEFISFILNEYKNDVIKVVKSLEDMGLLTDSVTVVTEWNKNCLWFCLILQCRMYLTPKESKYANLIIFEMIS